MLKNTIKIISSLIGIVGIIIGIAIIAIPAYYFIEKDLIIGNLGYNFFITEISLTVVIALLFGLFIGATLYKINYFSVKKTGIGLFGGFLGALVSGCPTCSITLASYLGLASFMYLFPYSGLELKVLSIIILFYANYTALKTLEVCKLKNLVIKK